MDYGDDSSFLHVTGLTRYAFTMLLDVVIPPWHRLHHRRKGRQWSLPPDGQLGLLLFYLGSAMTTKFLCLLFGITPSAFSRILHNMLRMAVRRLWNNPLARVQFPNEEKMQQFADMIKLREPEVGNVIGFMDGLSLTTECTSERLTQNAYYSGYHCDTMVNNVLAFGADGKVFFCALNYPGSWNDGSVTAQFFPHIKNRIGGYKICVDQGFPRSGDAYGTLVGPVSRRTAQHLHPAVRAYYLRLSNVYTSLRQASEWGMRGLQGTFPRIKHRLPSDCEKRQLVLECIVYIHNFRTDLVGQNQIQTVFDPEYERVINIEGYDRIHRYYYHPEDFEADDAIFLAEHGINENGNGGEYEQIDGHGEGGEYYHMDNYLPLDANIINNYN